jgi:hypothetical protein
MDSIVNSVSSSPPFIATSVSSESRRAAARGGSQGKHDLRLVGHRRWGEAPIGTVGQHGGASSDAGRRGGAEHHGEGRRAAGAGQHGAGRDTPVVAVHCGVGRALRCVAKS